MHSQPRIYKIDRLLNTSQQVEERYGRIGLYQLKATKQEQLLKGGCTQLPS